MLSVRLVIFFPPEGGEEICLLCCWLGGGLDIFAGDRWPRLDKVTLGSLPSNDVSNRTARGSYTVLVEVGSCCRRVVKKAALEWF